MRIATVVVAMSVAVVCTVAVASATDPVEQVDRMLCGKNCDHGYESCMRWRTGKGTQDCPGDLMRCRKQCDPTGEGAAIAKTARPRSCREGCLADFSDCVGRSDGKQRQDCAQTVMVCRQGCPPETEESAAAPEHEERPAHAAAESLPYRPITAEDAPAAAAPVAPGNGPADAAVAAPDAPAAAAIAAPAPAPAAAPVAASAAAPRPIPPQHAAAPASTHDGLNDRAAPAPHARAERQPESVASAASVPPSADVVRPRPASDDVPAATTAPRGNVFARAWCAVSGSCRATNDAPVSCEDRCEQTYDSCVERANPKRGGDCAPPLMRCRQDCERATASTAP